MNAEKVLTHVGEIVDENDFLNEMIGRPVEDRVDRAQQDRPCLVVETYYHRGRRKLFAISSRLLAPENKKMSPFYRKR